MKKRILGFFGACSVIAASWWGFTVSDDDFMMAVLGDSASTAFNSERKWNNLNNSWAGGRSVNSHYNRLVKLMPDKNVRVINLAVPGVDSHDVVRQAKTAASVELDYVTILIGSNDLCRGLDGIEGFRYRMYKAIKTLVDSSPDVKILLSSTPNIVQARHVAEDLVCDMVWTRVMEMCDVSSEDVFYESWWALNAVLDVIGQNNDNVIFSDAVMLQQIEPDSISLIDCFHASKQGQEMISELTWAQGWYK